MGYYGSNLRFAHLPPLASIVSMPWKCPSCIIITEIVVFVLSSLPSGRTSVVLVYPQLSSTLLKQLLTGIVINIRATSLSLVTTADDLSMLPVPILLSMRKDRDEMSKPVTSKEFALLWCHLNQPCEVRNLLVE